MNLKIMARIRVVIVLILGIMALGLLTWGIGKIYLELVGQSNRLQSQGAQTGLKDTNPDNNLVLVLPEVTFWTCQIGVFQTESNAQIRKEQLGILGFNAEVITANPWVVGIGLGHSASELKGLRVSLAEKGITTVPKQIALPERKFRVAGNGAQLTIELLTNANNIFKGEGIGEALDKENLVWNAMASNHPPQDLEVLHQYFNLVRAKRTSEEQKNVGLSLFYESQRIINLLSGK